MNPHEPGRPGFRAMLDIGRYVQRSTLYDRIIARTDEHFWNPLDPDYIDFDQPMPEGVPIIPFAFVPELQSEVGTRLDDAQKLELAQEHARWSISNLLHGEQGALSLSLTLGQLFSDPASQEYAANQAREESRHVHGFTCYLQSRFGGEIAPAGETLARFLTGLVDTDAVSRKIVGMQMVVEGVAMGAFSEMFQRSNDPVLRRLCQLVITDEAFHHNFGKLWAEHSLAMYPPDARDEVEDFALQSFNLLLFNLINTDQKRHIYARLGLDWQWVRGAMVEAFTDIARTEHLSEQGTVFRTLAKTLLRAGIITDRTRRDYAAWLDLDQLAAEHEPSDTILEEGLVLLDDINQSKRRIVHKIA